jgi:hypothetical protein
LQAETSGATATGLGNIFGALPFCNEEMKVLDLENAGPAFLPLMQDARVVCTDPCVMKGQKPVMPSKETYRERKQEYSLMGRSPNINGTVTG